MSRQLPPLNGLRSFEAAARHLSFTKAAEELYVTQAAISHQVKGLEEFIGHALFQRVNRGLKLTPEGQTLFPAIREGLDVMATAVRHLHATESAGTLTISTLDSFASGWLVPKLGDFRAQNPEIDVRLTMGDALVNFARDEIDLAIRYGKGDWASCQSHLLMSEVIFPVASPDLIANGPPLNEPKDILKYRLLHDSMPEDWNMWFHEAGIPNAKIESDFTIEHSHLIAQAAVTGQGIALGRSVLVGEQLKSGQLVQLFDITIPVRNAYYLVGPPTTWDRHKVVAFRNWLLEQIENT